ncbi:MAG: hypothetical protein KDL09_00980, partial [Prosthecobacter sp.]
MFVEAAQSLALRALHESSSETSKRLQKLFRLVLNRDPRAEELSRLRAFHAEQKARVQSAGPEALKVLNFVEKSVPPAEVVEAATLVATARVLMNLDEFINRE